MLFNSIEFALFLPVVFLLFWFVFNKTISRQNFLLLIASYVFYGWWDRRFLSLIISSFVDYFVGLGMLNLENKLKRKLLVTISILINIGFLGFLKYYNFFVDNFVDAFTLFGAKLNKTTLNIVSGSQQEFIYFQF